MAQDPRSGRYATIRLGGSSAHIIDLLGHWEVSIDLDTIDASKFGTVWKVPVPGMQGWSGTIEGFYEAATSSGDLNQNFLQYCMNNGALLQDIRFYIDSSENAGGVPTFLWPLMSSDLVGYDTGYGAYITGSRITQDKGGLATMNLDLMGYGAICCVTASCGVLGTSSDCTKMW